MLRNINRQIWISFLYCLYSKKLIAGQEALSVLDEEEEISSLEVGNINGNETMTNGREPSKKSTKKMSVIQNSLSYWYFISAIRYV